eukprot:TRINITY_DN92186_c0_g1_i1.p1 TRINITY_DN92186_c0_g1~~TRINITY_DN92186_c0_g1_i1.p1  ORF type:complete len:534 (-),score=53.23 TRINITY_DN92186_c0_g1_i1:208-1809(-)
MVCRAMVRFQSTAVLGVLSQIWQGQGAPQADVVESLPGWDKPLLSKAYSGYIDAGSEGDTIMHEHYLFFESEGDPKNDPVIMWTNGGPGAASFFGSFVELGPYYLSDASLKTDSYKSTGVPTLFENVWRWTKLGNLIIRNLPPPVGFSYCDPIGPSGKGTSCGSWNDTKVAKHSYEFLSNWRKAFPEYSANDLYLVGESYAGIYIPTLARQILRGDDSGLKGQLKGFAVGDGCIGGKHGGGCLGIDGPFFQIEFDHGHGQFSDKTYREIKSVCSASELVNGVKTDACKAALDKMDKEKGYYFAYNLYDECYDFALGAKRWDEPRTWFGPPRASPSGSGYEPHHMDGSPCGGTRVLPMWTNHSLVKKALHVADDAFFFDADNGHGFTYNITEPYLVPFYRDVVMNTDVRVLVYNGDTDPGINSFFTENWTSEVGIPEKEAWRPWAYRSQSRIGGYVTRYEHDFDFLTIRGSGHMVPEFKPEAAFTFIGDWIANKEYEHFKKPSALERDVTDLDSDRVAQSKRSTSEPSSDTMVI